MVSLGGDGIHQQLSNGTVVSPGSRMLGITKATASGKCLQRQGVLCFMPQDTELEEYQNKELQKGAVLTRGILLYELSRFRAMEKIMH